MNQYTAGAVVVLVLAVGFYLYSSSPPQTPETTTQPVPAEPGSNVTEMIVENTTTGAVVEETGVSLGGSVVPPAPPAEQVKEINITMSQFKFEPDSVTVKKGEKVRLYISSKDVTHGFFLGGYNVNVISGTLEPQVAEFTADKVGTFTFFCSVPCGSGHGSMKGTLTVTN